MNRQSSAPIKEITPPRSGMLMASQRAASTPPETVREYVTGNFSSSTRVEGCGVDSLEKSWRRQAMSEKKSQYFSEAFTNQDVRNTIRDRLQRDSVVIVDVKLSPLVSP